jgi:hypothetical protein
MGYRKSSKCVGKTTGNALTEYDTQECALEGARHAKSVYGSEMLPYRCGHCQRWHVAPASRQTPSSTCQACAGRDGQPKQAYETADAAERRAEILRRERGVYLTTYCCPCGQGWHLTKG